MSFLGLVIGGALVAGAVNRNADATDRVADAGFDNAAATLEQAAAERARAKAEREKARALQAQAAAEHAKAEVARMAHAETVRQNAILDERDRHFKRDMWLQTNDGLAYRQWQTAAEQWLAEAQSDLAIEQRLIVAAVSDAQESVKLFPIAEPPTPSDLQYLPPKLKIPNEIRTEIVAGMLVLAGLVMLNFGFWLMLLGILTVSSTAAVMFYWNENTRKPTIAKHNALASTLATQYETDLVFYHEPENVAERELQLMARVDYCGWAQPDMVSKKLGIHSTETRSIVAEFRAAYITLRDEVEAGHKRPIRESLPRIPQLKDLDPLHFGNGPRVREIIAELATSELALAS